MHEAPSDGRLLAYHCCQSLAALSACRTLPWRPPFLLRWRAAGVNQNTARSLAAAKARSNEKLWEQGRCCRQGTGRCIRYRWVEWFSRESAQSHCPAPQVDGYTASTSGLGNLGFELLHRSYSIRMGIFREALNKVECCVAQANGLSMTRVVVRFHGSMAGLARLVTAGARHGPLRHPVLQLSFDACDHRAYQVRITVGLSCPVQLLVHRAFPPAFRVACRRSMGLSTHMYDADPETHPVCFHVSGGLTGRKMQRG